jgi:hypothetical protein
VFPHATRALLVDWYTGRGDGKTHPDAELGVRHCGCRIFHPTRSGGVPILVDHYGEPVSAAYVQTGDSPWIRDWFGDSAQWCCLVHRLMGPVGGVVQLELAEGVAQVGARSR